MGDRAGSIGHTCRSFLAKLSRTKQVQQPGTARGEPGGSSRCGPCKLARLGVGHGGSLAVGVFVIVGYVAGEVTGPSVLLSLVIAAIVCLLTGYCYAEYTSHYPTRSMPATAYHYVYMLTGEFPAFLLGWCQVLVYLAASALLGRTISSTFDYLIGNQISNFTTYALDGTVALGLVPEPDFLAFTVVFAVALLVSIGGKPASLSNAIFGGVTCVVLMAVIILAGIHLASESLPLSASIFPEGHKGVLSGAAICIFLFSSYDVISTSSKNLGSSPNEIAHALAISSIVNLVFYLVLGMFCLLVAPYPRTDENPFVTRLFEEHWGKGAMYTVSVSAIVCVGSALFNNMCSMVYSVFLLGNDGLAFRFFGRLVSRLQSPCVSAVIFGGLCGALAIVFTERTLLDLTAVGLLLKQLIICACTLSHRYQKVKFDVNENVNLEDVLKNDQGENSETGGRTETVLRIKNGRPGHRSKHKRETRSGELSENGGAVATIDASQSNLKSVRFRDDSSDSSGGSDIEETDIDTIVEEYQDRLRVASLKHIENPLNRRTSVRNPTAFTSNMAAGFTILVCLWTAIVAVILTYRLPALETAKPWTISGTVVCTITSVVSVVVVVLQPPREIKPTFMSPLFPLAPYLGILMNNFLLFNLCTEAWIAFAVWLGAGLCFYFCYGICHSVEARRYSFRQPDEERILLPSIPEQAMQQEFVNGQIPKQQNIGYEDFHETP